MTADSLRRLISRLCSACAFGHADPVTERVEGVWWFVCGRCQARLGRVLGGDMITDGPAAKPEPVLGRPTGRVTTGRPAKVTKFPRQSER